MMYHDINNVSSTRHGVTHRPSDDRCQLDALPSCRRRVNDELTNDVEDKLRTCFAFFFKYF